MMDDSFKKGLIALLERTVADNRVGFSTSQKDSHDYVTSLDLVLEKNVKAYISEFYPDHQIFGEESVDKAVDFSKPCWVIDPLDGTSNFLFGLPFYACSIAYLDEEQVKAAFVYDFVHKDCFTAVTGQGAFMNERRLKAGNNSSDFIGISSGFMDKLGQVDGALVSRLKKIGKFRLLGAQSLHLCYVAAGKLKACVNYEAKMWDDLAGALIVEEASGRYSNRFWKGVRGLSIQAIEESLFSVAEADRNGEIHGFLHENGLKDL